MDGNIRYCMRRLDQEVYRKYWTISFQEAIGDSYGYRVLIIDPSYKVVDSISSDRAIHL